MHIQEVGATLGFTILATYSLVPKDRPVKYRGLSDLGLSIILSSD